MVNVFFALTGILELATEAGGDSARESVRLARRGRSREEVVAALAGEVDRLQRADRARMQRYERAAQSYLAEFRGTVPVEAPLEEAHAFAVRLAERSLPTTLEGEVS